MYSFSPIATVDTVNMHVGFYLILIAIIIVMVIGLINADDKAEAILIFAMATVVVGGAAAVSWNTGEIKEYKNTPVVGTLKGFVAEQYIQRKSTKPYSETTIHNQFVVYVIGDNEVMMPAAVGVTYPKQATLYKN